MNQTPERILHSNEVPGIERVLKRYNSLSEALEDIQFEDGAHEYKRMEFGYEDQFKEPSQSLTDEFFHWLTGVLQGRGLELRTEPFDSTGLIMAELFGNAYGHGGAETHPERTFAVEVFVGKKGILFGTEQDADFFTEERLQRFLGGEILSGGTDAFLRHGDGVFIDEGKKAIYVSRYWPSLETD